MLLPISTIVQDENETINLAKEFSKILSGGELVALNGDLGSGKTFFVKNVCTNYKIENVSSPSFAIVNEYSGKRKIYHFDFYRINKIEELFDIGIDEYFSDESSIKFIEWAELFPEIIPKKKYEIQFRYVDENKREIKIEKHE